VCKTRGVKIFKMGRDENQPSSELPDKVPVTLLCGFLGAGKTTLLKHILESKHSEEDFNAAVIVNDMAELNIDKSLIDNTSLIQSDEAMIGMQNGCICCTLQSDLVDQIIGLTQKKKFNYILIEASGVSEPHEIAPLFDLDDHEHAPDDVDHGHDHSKPQLGQVARLDTCVSLIDAADFYNNLASMKTYDNCDIVGTIAELMMDQVEFANVILCNKTDLVNEGQQNDIMEKLKLLNPKAKIVKSINSKIDVMEILNTSLYKDKEEFWVTSTKNETNGKEYTTNEDNGKSVPEACTARFDIKSFVYRARKPFHPKRLNELMLAPFFATPIDVEEEEDMTEEVKEMSEEEIKMAVELKNNLDMERDKIMEKLQTEAIKKQKERTAVMGELLRSKGFLWLATSNDLIGAWQQAGNVLRIRAETQWMCLQPEVWEGTPVEDLVRKDMQKENGEEWEYKDRRQEIVFIGHGMKREVIQKILDECLLTDKEMALGPELWKETMEEFDNIKLNLDEFEGEENEKEDECIDEDCEDVKCNEKEDKVSDNEESIGKVSQIQL